MSWIQEHIALTLEILAVLCGLVYVVLAALKNKWCWPFGIINSVISIYIFVVYSKYYAEAVLYSYYVLVGFIGWYYWDKHGGVSGKDIKSKSLLHHLFIIGFGILLSFGMSYILDEFFPESKRSLFDSFTTTFSFIATWLTVKKWIENWLYWIVINVATIPLYLSGGLNFYPFLMLINAVVAVYGYMNWRKLKTA